MCGLAGMIDLRGRRSPDPVTLLRMASTLVHRGPDEDGLLVLPGVGLAHRRLSLVGLEAGRQPIYNEDCSIAVICNGEFFDYPERKAELESKGHTFSTRTDSEILVHLYEEHGEDFFEHLKGQFAFVLFDTKRRKVLMARDRVGICPLHWSRQGDWVYFASEVKALLASDEVPAAIDRRGMDHLFTFFAMSTRRTMFEGVQTISPGHYLRFEFREDGRAAEIVERRYWDFDFPDAGQEEDTDDTEAMVDRFEAAFRRAVEIRLRADVPVVGYLSGGVDSNYALSMASSLRDSPIPSFTVGISDPKYDETNEALQGAKHIGSLPKVVASNAASISATYPDLVNAADSPVFDTSCAALLNLAREVHSQGFKAVITGEGADEAFAGYVWFRGMELMRMAHFGSLKASIPICIMLRKLITPKIPISNLYQIENLTGGPHGHVMLYHLISQGKRRYFSPELKQELGELSAYEELDLDLERMRRWHPLNRSLYLGYKIHLPGLLLNHKGDRIAMAASVETRYPFLDEDVIALASRIHPRWKMSRTFQNKALLRMAASRQLPKEIAYRPKGMFRAPLAESFVSKPLPYVRQLLSEDSLKATGYFDVEQVMRDAKAVETEGKKLGNFAGIGMVGVVATQLWHHLYLGGGLCELPTADLGEPEQPAAASMTTMA